MTTYQELDDIQRRLFITKINHSLLYDPNTYMQIVNVLENSKPSRPINLFPKEMQNEN